MDPVDFTARGRGICSSQTSFPAERRHFCSSPYNSTETVSRAPPIKRSQTSAGRAAAMKTMHSVMSFEIDAPVFPVTSRLNMRRPSKSLEFNALQFAEEARQDTIPEVVLEQLLDYPSPCLAQPGIADGDQEAVVTRAPPVRGRGRGKSRRTLAGSLYHLQTTICDEDDGSNNNSVWEPSSLPDSGADPDLLINNSTTKKDVDVQFNNTNVFDENEQFPHSNSLSGANGDLPINMKPRASSYLKDQFYSFFQPSDNKLALKLFGNKNAVNKEKQRQQQQGKLVIHPCSSFR